MNFLEKRKEQLKVFSLGDKIRQNKVSFKIDPNLWVNGPSNFDCLYDKWARKEVMGLIGGSGCVDSETEFLTTNGWKKIKDYVEGDILMEYNKLTGKGEFKAPLNFLKKESDGFYHIKSKYGIDQKLSKEHTVYTISEKGKEYFQSAKELVDEHNSSFGGLRKRFKTTFGYDFKNKISLTEEQLRLQVAFNADGYLYGKNIGTRNCIKLKKRYKKERLEYLLSECNIDYYKSEDKENGYNCYSFVPPLHTKSFGNVFDYSYEQLEIIAEECVLWDGNRKNIFRSSKKDQADFIQLVFTILGYRTTISCDNREGHGICYNVHSVQSRTSDLVSLRNFNGKKLEIPFIKSEPNEFKYCFETSTGLWVARRNGKIFITGNSGKSALILHFFKEVLTKNPDQLAIFVSLEMTDDKLAQRWVRMNEDSPELADRLFIVSNFDEEGRAKELTTDGILLECKRIKEVIGKKVAIIAIDHLHIIKPLPSQDLNTLCQKVKDIAIEMDSFIVLLSQTTKGKEGTFNDKPLDKDASFNCSQFKWIAAWVMTIHQPLGRVKTECDLHVLAWSYQKIREKRSEDGVIEGVYQLAKYDMDTGNISELTRDEMSTFQTWYGRVLELRNQEEEENDAAIYNTKVQGRAVNAPIDPSVVFEVKFDG